jgi:hypothetical protein
MRSYVVRSSEPDGALELLGLRLRVCRLGSSIGYPPDHLGRKDPEGPSFCRHLYGSLCRRLTEWAGSPGGNAVGSRSSNGSMWAIINNSAPERGYAGLARHRERVSVANKNVIKSPTSPISHAHPRHQPQSVDPYGFGIPVPEDVYLGGENPQGWAHVRWWTRSLRLLFFPATADVRPELTRARKTIEW